MAGKPAPNTVRVKGAVELRLALIHMEGGLNDLTAIHRKTAEIVATDARGRAPRRSGALAGSIRVAASPRAGAVLAGSRLVPYAGPIHFGWPAHNIEPQMFLYTALDARRREVIDVYRKRVEDLVKRLDRETPG